MTIRHQQNNKIDMPGRHARLAALLLCIGLNACATRPMQPPPPLYTLWEKPGVTGQGVRSAMRGCGFADPAHVGQDQMTTNDFAGAELCMLDQGFTYKDRRIVCTDSPDLPACSGVPRGRTFGTDPDFAPELLDRNPPRPPAYSLWSRPGTDTEGVRRAMQACGYASVITPADVMKLNDIAAAELCMIDQHFTYALPAYALLCKNPPSLPACRHRAIDVQRCCASPKAAGQR